jgi:hypothetical protein
MGSLREGEVLGSLTAGDYYLAVTGGLTGVPDWVMSGKSLDNFCYCDIVDPCVLGTWKVLSSSAADAAGGMTCTWPNPWGALLNIDTKGNWVENFGSVPDVHCTSGTEDIVLRFGGTSSGKLAWADHGYAKGSGDPSGVTVEEFVNGVDAGTFTAASFGLDASPTTSVDSYTCGTNTLSFTTSTGNIISLARP